MTADKSPAKETIYVDVEDDISAIIDKVEAAKSGLVALVLPKRAASLQSIVNMRLLAKNADQADKKIVLVTSEAAILPLAGAARIPVAKSLTSAPEIPPVPGPLAEPSPVPPPPSADDDEETYKTPAKIDYKKPIGELASAKGAEDLDAIELGDDGDLAAAAAGAAKVPKAPKKSKLKVPNFDRFRLWMGLAIAGAVALIVFIFLAIFVLPKAVVAITTTSTPVTGNFSITTSGSAKTVSGTTIPGFNKTADQSGTQTVSATGKQNNGDKATGNATLSAGACSGTVPSDVPAGTGISSSGLTFITQKTASFSPVVSGGQCTFQSNSVGVIAQQGGTKYNTSFTGASVSGHPSDSASGSASGGTDNIVTVVSQSDVDGAKNQLTGATGQNSFTQKFENDLANQGYYVFVSTLKINDPQITANPAVGQPATTTSVSIKVTYSVLAVKKTDLTQAITAAMAKQIDSSKQKLDPNGILSGADISVSNQTSPTDATLNINESAAAVPIIDTNALKKQVKGQKSGQIESIISSIPGVQKVTVKFSPFWVSKAPNKISHITITTQHVGS